MSERGDITGLGGFGDAVNTATKALAEAINGFLARICHPAAEEFGLLLRDRVAAWRVRNLARIVEVARRNLERSNRALDVSAHPRIVQSVLDNGSWSDCEEVQVMWGGLLASSCTSEGRDESNLIFISLLGQLTSSEARMLNHICKQADKSTTPAGLIWADRVSLTLGTLREIAGVDDINRIDRELDHLQTLGLTEGVFSIDAHLTAGDSTFVRPTSLALNMFVRCSGSLAAPAAFFELTSTEVQNAANSLPPK